MTLQMAEAGLRPGVANGGIAYAVIATARGFVGSVARSPLFAHNEATAAAVNVLMAEPLFRLGFAANLLAVACYLTLTLVLPQLFKLGSASLSLLAVFFGAMGHAMSVAMTLVHLVPLLVLGGVHHLIAF
jgi:uncharacterized protein DUF4386